MIYKNQLDFLVLFLYIIGYYVTSLAMPPENHLRKGG